MHEATDEVIHPAPLHIYNFSSIYALLFLAMGVLFVGDALAIDKKKCITITIA